MKYEKVGFYYFIVVENQHGEKKVLQPIFGDETIEDLLPKGKDLDEAKLSDFKLQK